MTRAKHLLLLAAIGHLAFGLSGPACGEQARPTAVTVASRPNAGVGPTEVSVGMWLANVDRIDSVEQSFAVNLFILLRWRDPRLAHRASAEIARFRVDDIWHPRIQLLNPASAVRRTLPETADVEPDGTVVYRQRFITKLSQRLDLSDFPFDRQLFHVHLVSVGNTPEDVAFVPDEQWVATGLRQAAGIADNVSLPDWEITEWGTGPAPHTIVPGREVAGYAFRFEARRAPEHYVRKVILPLIIIAMMSWAVFWIDPENAGPKISVAVTSMLTLIAYRFVVGRDVPRVPYTTRMDTFILATTALVFLSLTQVILTSSLVRRDRAALADKIDRVSRVLFPVAFAAVVILSLAV